MTTVKLKQKDQEHEFSIEHANALLNYEKQLGLQNWTLEDKNFELKDGLIKRKNSRANKESPEQEVDSEGDRPSE